MTGRTSSLSWKPLAAGCVIAGLGLFAGYMIWGRGGGSTPFAIPPPTAPPGEYLYLDSPRVATYLSQIENGLTSNETVSLSRTDVLGGNITAGGLGIQGTTQTQHSLHTARCSIGS